MESVSSSITDMTDDFTEPFMAHEMKSRIEPMDTEKARTAICDILSDVDLEEPLCDFLGQMDNVEDTCYAYMGNLIGRTPILRAFVDLYRGNDGFLIVSKHTQESWIKGVINKTSFSIHFMRPESECAPTSGEYLQLEDVFIEEVEYRIGTLSITKK